MDRSNGAPERIDSLVTRVGLLRQRFSLVETELRVLGEDVPDLDVAGVAGVAGNGTPGAPEGAVATAEPPPSEEVAPDRLTVATTLAVGGDTREHAAEYLEMVFGTTDNDEVLDEVFGKGGPAPEASRKRRWRRGG